MKKLTETEYLSSSKANRKRLLKAIKRVERREAEISEIEKFKTLSVVDDEQHKEFSDNGNHVNKLA